MRPGLVALQSLFHQVVDHLLVFAALHVDEIADDQSADIAQSELARNFIGRFQVRLQNGFLHIAAAFVAACVYVDSDECLGFVDHDVAAAFEPHLSMKRVVDLLLHTVGFENRRCAIVKVNLIPGAPRNLADHFAHPVRCRAIVAKHFVDFFGQEIAHRPLDQIRFFKNATRRRRFPDLLLDFGPLIEKEPQITDEISCALALAHSSNNHADAFRNIELAQNFPETIAFFRLFDFS